MRDDLIGRLERANPSPRGLEPPSFERLRGRILRAADDFAPPKSSSVPGPHAGRVRRALPLALSVAVAVAVAVAAIVVLGHRGTSPRPTPAPAFSAPAGLPPVPNNGPGEKAAESYLARYRQTVDRTAACRPKRLFQPRAKPDRGVPDRQLLAALGVLRLPAARSDTRFPLPALFGSVFVRYIRVAQRHDGTIYRVFPVKNTAARVSARCDRLQLAAVQRDVQQAPKRLRAQILRLADDDFLDDRYRRAHPDEACLSGGGAGCTNLLDLETTGMIGSGGSGEQGSTWSYLVPDGVASIIAHYPAEGPKTGFRRRIPAVTITAKVINNVAVWNMINEAGDIFPDRIIWRSADGRAVRIVYPS